MMKIKFFEKDGRLNPEAIYAGVYQFSIGVQENTEDSSLPLYIGESYSMLSRCSNHLYEIFHTDPSYFGLTKENLEDERLQLIVDIYVDKHERIYLPDGISNSDRDILLRSKEKSAIEERHPLSQNSTNDNLRKDRVEIVQDAIRSLFADK